METKPLTIMLVESGNSPKKSVRPLSGRSVSSNLGEAPAAWFGAGTFILMHVACLAVFLTGTSVLALSLCGGCYLLQMVGITVGYHRYFSHRAYKTSRAFQFVLACLGCSAGQKGPLWWAAQHRHHHRTSDTPEDLHSPVTHSLWWSHIGWVLSRDSQGTDAQVVRDLSRFPELRWLDRCHWAPPLVLAGLCLLAAGWAGLVWGFIVATVLSHHATFLVASATGMKTVCAQYRQLITTTPTTVPVSTTRARCQAGAADIFGTDHYLQGEGGNLVKGSMGHPPEASARISFPGSNSRLRPTLLLVRPVGKPKAVRPVETRPDGAC